jgi:hypothetical protein
LSPSRAARRVAQNASRQHGFPDGSSGMVSRNTLDRWTRNCRAGRRAARVRLPRQPGGAQGEGRMFWLSRKTLSGS